MATSRDILAFLAYRKKLKTTHKTENDLKRITFYLMDQLAINSTNKMDNRSFHDSVKKDSEVKLRDCIICSSVGKKVRINR